MGIGDGNLELICRSYTPIKQIRRVVSYILCRFGSQLISIEALYIASGHRSVLIYLQKIAMSLS